MKIILFTATFVLSFIFTVVFRFGAGVVSAANAQVQVAQNSQDFAVNGEDYPSTLLSVKWGGYYARQTQDGYRVFRLLDLNPNHFHYISYDRIFPEMPHLADISFVIPEDGHVVKKGIEILRDSPVLFGSQKLTPDDVSEYQGYLLGRNISPAEAESELQRIISLSAEPPLPTRLSADGQVLRFDEGF